MAFEKFDDSGSGRGRPAGTDPMISLRKSGSIGINQAALTEFFEENEGAVMYMTKSQSGSGLSLWQTKMLMRRRTR